MKARTKEEIFRGWEIVFNGLDNKDLRIERGDITIAELKERRDVLKDIVGALDQYIKDHEGEEEPEKEATAPTS